MILVYLAKNRIPNTFKKTRNLYFPTQYFLIKIKISFKKIIKIRL